ncbi:MAG: AzlD domain-containing protein [Pseudomonadota bacterium]
MSLFDTPWGLLAIAFAASFFWRALGVLLSGRIEIDTPLFDWCVCVTQALVGGLMVRAILLPSTALADVPLIDRLIACAIGAAVFCLMRWQVMPGVAAGTVSLAALIAVRGL